MKKCRTQALRLLSLLVQGEGIVTAKINRDNEIISQEDLQIVQTDKIEEKFKEILQVNGGIIIVRN